jgi:hypothetical protein
LGLPLDFIRQNGSNRLLHAPVQGNTTDENAGGPRFVEAAVVTEHDPPSRHAFSEEFAMNFSSSANADENRALGEQPSLAAT